MSFADFRGTQILGQLEFGVKDFDGDASPK
jgi:hypothetical protein